MPADPEPKSPAALERIKLSASYLNIVASGLITTGAAAPTIAFALGVTNAGQPLPIWTLLAVITTCVTVSVVLHFHARRVLKGLDP